MTTLSLKTYEVADLFCGAGGSSSGAKQAIEELGGRMKLVAINHWNTAIATHAANHPDATHIIEDVSIVKPEDVVASGRLDLLMASPECTYFSTARGGKPVNDQGRMNAWAIHNWLTKLDVQAIIVENVPEFVKWGPLLPNDKPDPDHKGEIFQAWFNTFINLGYRAEWKMLNAANYGDATTRTRFFLMARKDGRPIQWPEPSHAKADTPLFPGRKPWRGAWEIIDWTHPGRSLLDDPKYRRHPLSPNTRRRIAKGLLRYGGQLAPLYIRLLDLPDSEVPEYLGITPNNPQSFILNRHGENGYDRTHPVDEPLPTVTTRGGGYLLNTQAQPFTGANRNQNAPKPLHEPIPALTTAQGGGIYFVSPEAEPFVCANRTNSAPRTTDKPVPTITATNSGGSFLIQPFILGQQSGGAPRPTDDPIPTVTADGAIGLVGASLVQYNGNGGATDINKPVPTITTKERHALVNPTLVEVNHTDSPDRRTPALKDPIPSPTTKRALGLASPVLVQTSQTGGNGSYSRPTNQPLPTVTTQNDMHIVTPTVQPCDAQRNDHHAALIDSLKKANIDPRRLVLIDDQPFLLDIRFRMLQNDELARAMGFDDDDISYEFHGNVTEVTKQIGNAVPVHLAAALVRSALAGDQE